METTWDMSPAKRKMFIFAAGRASWRLVVRARRGTLLVAGFSCFSFPGPADSLLFRKRGAGVDAVKMKDPRLLRFPSFHAIGPAAALCLLASVLPAASEVRVSVGQAGLIQSSAGGSGVRPERPDAVQPGGSRASDGLQHY